MIDVVMGEKKDVQPRTGETLRNLVDVFGLTDPGVYQRRRGTRAEVCAVPRRARPFRGVAGGQHDHHRYQ
jgi:hypothetical protein